MKAALFRKGSKSEKTFFIEEDISKYNSDSKRVYIETITYCTNKLCLICIIVIIMIVKICCKNKISPKTLLKNIKIMIHRISNDTSHNCIVMIRSSWTKH